MWTQSPQALFLACQSSCTDTFPGDLPSWAGLSPHCEHSRLSETARPQSIHTVLCRYSEMPVTFSLRTVFSGGCKPNPAMVAGKLQPESESARFDIAGAGVPPSVCVGGQGSCCSTSDKFLVIMDPTALEDAPSALPRRRQAEAPSAPPLLWLYTN